jgi:hypothetical protein
MAENNTRNLQPDTLPADLTLYSFCDYRARVAASRIIDDIRDGILPTGTMHFAEMHDYVDANMYLIDEEHPVPLARSPYEWPQLDTEGVCQQLNRIMAGAESILAEYQRGLMTITRQLVREPRPH